jgi:hypothetical protein
MDKIKLTRSFNLLKRFQARSSSATTSSFKNYPTEVTIVEVGPRDGLQNEKVYIYIFLN